MKQIITALSGVVMLGALAFAQKTENIGKDLPQAQPLAEESTWHGYLVDVAHGDAFAREPASAVEKASTYEKSELLKTVNQKGGFGIFTLDGNWYTFDTSGNGQAVKILTGLRAERGVMVTVTGTLQKQTIAVTSIKEREPAPAPNIN